MKISSLATWIIALATVLTVQGSIEAADLRLKAGIGYDFLSQEFFLDSTAVSGVDSFYTDWNLKTNYLDDIKGLLSLSYTPFSDRRLYLQTSYEQTRDYLRTRFLSDTRLKFNSSRLDLNNELEWKHRLADSATVGDSYLLAYSRARLTTPLSAQINGHFQLKGDMVAFDSVSDLSYNYYRLEARTGVSKSFEDFSFAEFSLLAQTRQVPDSTFLNYLSLGGDISSFVFYSSGVLDLYARLEHKDYNQPDNKDDHFHFEITSRNRNRLGGAFFSRQELDLELTFYSPESTVNYDYHRFSLAVLGGLEEGVFSTAIGPRLEYLTEETTGFLTSNNYLETGIRVDADLMMVNRLFLSAESTTGLRNLKYEDDLQSDYTFQRVNLIGDLKVFVGLNLSFLLSTEWEWHGNSTENSALYLLSSNLTYTF